MQQVVRELHATKKAYKEAMEVQRYGFQVKLEKVIKELYQVESRLIRLEYKMNILKDQKQIPELRLTQDTLATQNTQIMPFSIKPPKEKELTSLFHKNYTQMTILGLPKITTKKAWIEVTRSNQRRKATISNTLKVELEKKKVIFHQEILSFQKSEGDLTLALNELLQKAGIPTYTQFSKVKYL